MQIQYLKRVSTVKWEPRITQILRCAGGLPYVLRHAWYGEAACKQRYKKHVVVLGVHPENGKGSNRSSHHCILQHS